MDFILRNSDVSVSIFLGMFSVVALWSCTIISLIICRKPVTVKNLMYYDEHTRCNKLFWYIVIGIFAIVDSNGNVRADEYWSK